MRPGKVWRWVSVAALVVAAAPVTAAVRYSDVLIEVRSTFSGFTVIEDTGGSVVAPDDPQIFTTLVQPPGLVRFPTSPSALPGGFASATFTALRLGGVGASGIALNRFTAEGVALYEQTLYSESDEAMNLYVDYTIPNLEVAVMAGPSIPQGPEATARAALEVTVCNQDLSSCFDEDVFVYLLRADKVPTGVDFERSPDLLLDAGDGVPYTEGDVSGVRYGSFSGSLPILLPANGVVDIRYSFTAFGSTSTPETGYQAFVGDPFDIREGDGQIAFRVVPIPEPYTWATLVCGLAVVALAARRRAGVGRGGGRIASREASAWTSRHT